MPSNHHILWCPLLLLPSSFLASVAFPMSWLFESSDQNTGASASASVLPMNVKGWFSLGLNSLISWLSIGLSGVFCSTIVQGHQFFGALPSFSPGLTNFGKSRAFSVIRTISLPTLLLYLLCSSCNKLHIAPQTFHIASCLCDSVHAFPVSWNVLPSWLHLPFWYWLLLKA